MFLVLSVSLLVAFVVSTVATRAARDLAHRYDRLDHPDGHPDGRKAHARAVPRVGGVGIATGAAAGLAALLAAAALTDVRLPLAALAPVVAGASIVFALGLWDDLVTVGFKTRFLVQAFVAWSMTLAGWHIDLSNVPLVEWLDPYEQAAISVPLTVIWTVGLINAMNLLDGLDALAGGTALLGFAALGVAFLPAADPVMLALCTLGAGGVLGFLVYNRTPASVFMGDGGSTLLGFLLAMTAVRGVASMPSGGLVILPVVALGLPILDTLTTMGRRIAEGQSPFLPDADHLHHRALARSGNVRVAVAKLHAMALTFGLLAVLLRFVTSEPLLQALVLLLTAAFAYAVVRSLGYVRTRDVARMIIRRFGYLKARRMARAAAARRAAGRPSAPGGDGRGDGRSTPVPHLDLGATAGSA